MPLAAADNPASTSAGAYGSIATNARSYRALDLVTVSVTGRAKGDTTCRVRVADPGQRVYF